MKYFPRTSITLIFKQTSQQYKPYGNAADGPETTNHANKENDVQYL